MTHRHFESLQSQRREIFAIVAEMPFEQQVHRPSADSWSPLEVLEHLNLHDGWVLANPTVRKGPPSGSPFLWLGKRLSLSGVRFPTAPFLEPKGGFTLPELAATSDANHQKLASLVTEAHPGETIVAVFPFGALTADQLSEGLDAHYAYHLRRI